MSDTATLPPARLLRVDDAAGMLGVSRARLYELTRQGDVPSVSLGRSYRWDRRALDAWIASGGTRG